MHKHEPCKMILKPSFLTIACVGLLLIGCGNITDKNAKSPTSGKEVITVLDSLFQGLANLERPTQGLSEDVVQVNENIRRTVENIRSSDLLAEIGKEFASKEHDFSFILSEDKKLGVFSWHTKMNTSGNKIKNIALYSTGDKIEPSSLYDTPIIYDKIHQVESYKGKNLYVLHGHLNSGDGHYFRLNAYILKNGYLEEAPAFPDNESSMSIAQILKNPKLSDPLGFKVEMNGSRILFPEMRDTTIVEHSLAFNGKKYVPERNN